MEDNTQAVQALSKRTRLMSGLRTASYPANTSPVPFWWNAPSAIPST